MTKEERKVLFCSLQSAMFKPIAPMNNQSLIELLYKQYEKEPKIKLLLEAISAHSGFPINPIIDSLVGNKVKDMMASRMRSFYDELNNGDVEINDSLIENEDFLHAYFSVTNYVVRSKRDEKSKRFARIIKSLYNSKLDINQCEDFTSIFNELSDREFAVLCLKYEFENREINARAFWNANSPLDDYEITKIHWFAFVKEAKDLIEFEEGELPSLLIRLQRTGCYKPYFGHYKDEEEGIGNTTSLFHKLYNIAKE